MATPKHYGSYRRFTAERIPLSLKPPITPGRGEKREGGDSPGSEQLKKKRITPKEQHTIYRTTRQK
jgi:hypothetical protein